MRTTDVKMDNLLFGNSLYSSDDDLLHYLESSPPKVEGEVNLDGQTYLLAKPQPIPHRYTWDTSAFDAETMIIYLTDLGQGAWVYAHPSDRTLRIDETPCSATCRGAAND